MKHKMISILIPVYNTSVHLPKCLDSIISQDYSNIEIIVVNDGSTDNSLEILTQYSLKYSAIKVYSQANKGHQSARKLAIEMSQGDYICFVDSDDSLPSNNVISKMVEVVDDNVQIVVGRINICNGESERVFPASKFSVISSSEYLQKYLLCGKSGWNLCGKLFREDLVKSVNGSPIKVTAAEDALYTILMANKAHGSVVMVNMPVYNYYVNSASITHQCNPKLIYDNYNVANYINNHLDGVVDVKYRVAFKLLCFANSFRYGYLGSRHILNKEIIESYNNTKGVLPLLTLKKQMIVWTLIHFGDSISRYIYKNYRYEE